MTDKDAGLRENIEQTGKSVLGASRTELYIDMRFMASALSSLGYEMDLSTTSVGTDAVNIRFNPTYVLRLFVEEPGKLNRTYIHMLLHCIFRHMYNGDDKDKELWDLSCDIAVSAVECARVVIAQVNKSIPYLYGECLIHESQIDAAVLVDEPPVAMVFGEPTPIEAAIGANVASKIPDGACLQIGVGGIPNAVLNGIKHHQHLGLHTEAMTDGVIRLMKEGVIDNSLKKVRPGVSVAALAIGSKEMYRYIDHNPTMEFFDVAYTNNPFLIAQNPRACAINSAIEVDLTGQICADSIGEKIFSSVGGQHDFMYGCSLSEGGRTFIALPSRTAKGKAKIVPTLTPGAGVVTTRFQTQYVATEYGIVYLRGKSLAERARLLISIAHPDDREMLEEAACKRFGYSFLRIK